MTVTPDGGAVADTALPVVPLGLTARGIALRRETEQDGEFLRHLYISVRWEELAGTGWPDDAKIGFLSQQFVFQMRHYKSHYDGAAWGIVTESGTPVGRLYLCQARSEVRIIDVSLLPSHRAQGIGTELIRAVFEQGSAAGTSVSIHVEVFNHGARRLYERLGFVQTSDGKGVYHRMDWFPPLASSSEAGPSAQLKTT